MKDIKIFIEERQGDINLVNEAMFDVDYSIINESLNVKILRDLAKQLKDEVTKEKSELKDDDYVYTYKRDTTFAYIFGGVHAMWSKITDGDVSEVKNFDVTDKTAVSKIKAIYGGKDYNTVLIAKKDDKFTYCILPWRSIIGLSGNERGQHKLSFAGRGRGGISKFKNPKVAEAIELFKGNDLYFIDIELSKSEFDKLRTERNIAKNGIISYDAQSLKEIAFNNRKRYEDIIRKNRANAENNDEVLDAAKKIIDIVADWSNKAAKNPDKYADVLSSLSALTNYVYLGNPWEYSSDNSKAILGCLVRYTTSLHDTTKQSNNSYDAGKYKLALKNLKETIGKCEEIIEKIKGSFEA